MSEEVNRQSKEVVLVTNNSVLKKEFGVQLKCFNDMSLKSISWIWQDWLAAGKFHLLAGAPGTGKTTIGLSLAATITAGVPGLMEANVSLVIY